MRKVDDLGRIVIPKELRKKYGMFEGTEICFVDSGDGILVKREEALCRLCNKRLSEEVEIPLCEQCINMVMKEYKKYSF